MVIKEFMAPGLTSGSLCDRDRAGSVCALIFEEYDRRGPRFSFPLKCVPYYQVAGPLYCSSPAREYVSKPAADRQRDTDGWWRQVTKLPRPIPQYPPFTLRYGSNAHCSITLRARPSAGQQVQGPARTFDAIVLTGRRGERSPPFVPLPARRQSSRLACTVMVQLLTY